MEANKKSPKTIQSTKGVFILLDKFKPIDKIQKDDLIKFFSEFNGADSSREIENILNKFRTYAFAFR